MHSLPPLLSPKPFGDFTPQEFFEYVKGLYKVPIKKGPKPKPVKAKPLELEIKFNRKGHIHVTCRRSWKWVTMLELEHFGVVLKVPINELFLLVKKRNYVVCKDAAEALSIETQIKEIPF